MKTINDVHQQFAAYFNSKILEQYAYLLSRKISEGNICLPLNELTEEELRLLKELYNDAIPTIKELSNVPLVDADNSGKQPFVIHNQKLYLQRYFVYETILLNRIKDFVGLEAFVYEERKNKLAEQSQFIEALFREEKAAIQHNATDQTNWQLAAAITGVLNNFTIITGGPGTGKTTTVAKILAILFTLNPALKVALAAPTGKAAARMAESLKNAKLAVDEQIVQRFQQLVPSTLHRLLKTDYGTPHFKHNKHNPLNVDVVIVDESSMIDVALFAKLMDAIGPATRLILLGDKDQLASVEAGSLFGDLCQALPALNLFTAERMELINSFIDDAGKKIKQPPVANGNAHPLFQHIIELQHSHRFSDQEGIGKFSKAIINDDVAVIESFFGTSADNKVTIDHDYSISIFNDFIEGYTDFIKEKDIATALKKLNKLRVLCALREGGQGLHAINKRIEDRLQQLKLIRRPGEFYEHRPIMVTSNNYELGLFNGDIGIIRNNEKGIAMAWFEDSEGNLKTVLPGYIAQAETVFAMTIHKSQGSEFTNVLMVLPARGAINLLTRELLYTGITRAREKLVVQGSKEVILNASKQQVKRTSGIIERFTES